MSTWSDPVVDRVIALDVSLDWLIAATKLRGSIAKRRLNGIENVLALLAKRWRSPTQPIHPHRELRMCEETTLRLLAWVDVENTEDGSTVERLTVYASGALTDASVPVGWVRLLVDP